MSHTAQPTLAFPVNHSSRHRLRRLWAGLKSLRQHRPPIQRFRVEHTTQAPARFWFLTRAVWNMTLIAMAAILLWSIVAAYSVALDVQNDHPELWQALRLYLSEKVTGWESRQGVTCLTWAEISRDERGNRRIEVREGGPTCMHPPSDAIPPAPAIDHAPPLAPTQDKGDAP